MTNIGGERDIEIGNKAQDNMLTRVERRPQIKIFLKRLLCR